MNEAIGIAGLVVSVLGFSGTIWQLARTVKATKATAAAVKDANRRMLLNHLLVLLPQLRALEADLDASIAAKDQFTAIRTLVNFSHTANQIAALLEAGDESVSPPDTQLIDDLRDAAKNSTKAKTSLVYSTGKALTPLLRPVSLELSDLAARCAGLSTQYQSKVA